MLADLGWRVTTDEHGRPVGASHPEGRRAVFVGDLVDRGPDSAGVLRLVMGMCADGDALTVQGNHDAKLARALRGAQVNVRHGLAQSLAQIDAVATGRPVVDGGPAHPAEPDFPDRVLRFLDAMAIHLVLDGGDLVVAHAGLKEAFHGRESHEVCSFALYGDVRGEYTPEGLPVRREWEREYRGDARVVYGHTPITRAEWVNRTMCLDTGCVFGGELTALRYPELEVVAVPARRTWWEPTAPRREPAHDRDSARRL